MSKFFNLLFFCITIVLRSKAFIVLLLILEISIVYGNIRYLTYTITLKINTQLLLLQMNYCLQLITCVLHNFPQTSPKIYLIVYCRSNHLTNEPPLVCLQPTAPRLNSKCISYLYKTICLPQLCYLRAYCSVTNG